MFIGTQLLNFRQELFLNLTRCTEGTEWITVNVNASKAIPNLEFIIAHVTEIGRLHYVIKDYINSNKENFSRVVKALKLDLQKEIDSYYVYINTWVNIINYYRQFL